MCRLNDLRWRARSGLRGQGWSSASQWPIYFWFCRIRNTGAMLFMAQAKARVMPTEDVPHLRRVSASRRRIRRSRTVARLPSLAGVTSSTYALLAVGGGGGVLSVEIVDKWADPGSTRAPPGKHFPLVASPPSNCHPPRPPPTRQQRREDANPPERPGQQRERQPPRASALMLGVRLERSRHLLLVRVFSRPADCRVWLPPRGLRLWPLSPPSCFGGKKPLGQTGLPCSGWVTVGGDGGGGRQGDARNRPYLGAIWGGSHSHSPSAKSCCEVADQSSPPIGTLARRAQGLH